MRDCSRNFWNFCRNNPYQVKYTWYDKVKEILRKYRKMCLKPSTRNETYCVDYDDASEFIISDRVFRLFFEFRTVRPIMR